MIQPEKGQSEEIGDPEIFMTLRDNSNASEGLVALIKRDNEEDDEEPVDNTQD